MKCISKTQRQFYINLARELHYEEEFISRFKHCQTLRECERTLEYARIHSIYEDMYEDDVPVAVKSGFTLIELIIVIAIMAILVGILAPSFVKYVNRAKMSRDVYTADQIARAVNIAFVENPEAYDAYQAWTGLSANVSATYNDKSEHYTVYLIAANEAPTYCFKGGESKFGNKSGSTGFYGVINRELGLSTTEVNTSISPKIQVSGISPKNPEKAADRWRICKRQDNGQLEIWLAQTDPWGGYPVIRAWPNPDDVFKKR